MSICSVKFDLAIWPNKVYFPNIFPKRSMRNTVNQASLFAQVEFSALSTIFNDLAIFIFHPSLCHAKHNVLHILFVTPSPYERDVTFERPLSLLNLQINKFCSHSLFRSRMFPSPTVPICIKSISKSK